MADTQNKLITLPLLSLFKDKIQEWAQSEDSALRTELLGEIGKLTSFEVKLVDALPETGEKGFIYFVPKAQGAQSNVAQNVYEEFLWITSGETSAFEKIGDTQVDIAGIKNDIAKDYVASVDVTSSDATDEEGVTKTTYVFSFKNGKGEQIDTESIVVGGGYAKATTEKDGLMSKEDKAKLDDLADSLDSAVEGIDVEITSGEAVVTGNTSVKTVTVALKNGETQIDSGTFDVTTYGEATAEAAGLMSAADKAKLDSYEVVTEAEIEALFASQTENNKPDVAGA
jgi:hypothetical protein